MAFGNSGRRNRRFPPRRRGMKSKKNPSSKTLNKKIKKIQKLQELKYVDTYFNDTVDNTGSDAALLNSLQNGDGPNQREGNEVYFTSLQMRGSITVDPEWLQPTIVRLLVIWDRQANGGVPVVTSALPGAGLLANNIVTDLTESPFTYEQQERYRVIYDKRFVLNPQMAQTTASGAVTTVFPVSVLFKKKIKLSRTTKWTINGAGITTINSNSLFFIAISNQPTGLVEPLVQVGFRAYFKDA